MCTFHFNFILVFPKGHDYHYPEILGVLILFWIWKYWAFLASNWRQGLSLQLSRNKPTSRFQRLGLQYSVDKLHIWRLEARSTTN